MPDKSTEEVVQNSPLYREGLVHLQAGKWDEAIACFETLVVRYPDSELAEQALQEAYFKASLDAETHIRPRRTQLPWRSLSFGILFVVALALVGWAGQLLFRQYLSPLLQQAEITRQHERLLAEGSSYLSEGDYDAAQARFEELLTAVPDHQGALEGLARVSKQRELAGLYQEGIAAQNAGDLQSALIKFTEITMREPDYRDVGLRVTALKQQQEIATLLAEADQAYADGDDQTALFKYQQIRTLSVNYKAAYVTDRLFELYMRLGRAITQSVPPVLEQIPQALEYFDQALALRPDDPEALSEQRLTTLFIDGRSAFRRGLWELALTRLSAVYAERPDYLGGTVTDMLYQAYMRWGEQLENSNRNYLAYEQYRQASDLPVANNDEARTHLASVAVRLTPTPTPIPTGTPPPTLPPTEVPTPLPLTAYRNQIVFLSDDEEQPGYWVMNPDGSNRRYLGRSRALDKEYQALVEAARYSPDGRYYAFVRRAGRVDQIFVLLPQDPSSGQQASEQITDLSRLCYDPVWAPDGSRIAFVSQQDDSDDIWIVYPDGSQPQNLTENRALWDKHPSWSPDSLRIVFWSNRTGQKQIFVMDADGRNQRNISNTAWDEYDPIWIR